MARLPRRAARPAALVAAALAAAAASLLLGASLRVDPLGWLRWGRALALGDGAFSTADYPSWKPLPLLLTVPLAPFGAAAGPLLLIVLRAGGFLALAGVFEIARRRAGPMAGLVAAGALALVPGWWPALAGGAIEPAVVALACLAVLRHEAGRPGQTLALLGVMALGREEAVPLVVLYGACLLRRDRRWLPAAVLSAATIAGLWLTGDWLGSGDPLHGGALARAAPDAVALRAGGVPAWTGLETIAGLMWGPLWIVAGLGVAAAVRAGDRRAGILATAALLWAATDLALAASGYPLQTRFLFPAAAMFCVAAGLGTAALADRASGGRGAVLAAGRAAGGGP